MRSAHFFISTLLIVIIYINNLNRIFSPENKNCPVLPVNSETPNPHLGRLQQFSIKARMKGILRKYQALFSKLRFKPPLSHILQNPLMNLENIHVLKYEERRSPRPKLFKNFWLYFLVARNAPNTSVIFLVGGGEKISFSITCRKYSYLNFASSSIRYSFLGIVITLIAQR